MRSFTIKIENHSYTHENYQDVLRNHSVNVNQLSKVVSFLDEWNNEKDFIYINTSGSTGSPKKIKLLKAAMLVSAEMTCNFFKLNKSDTSLLCLPVEYIAGKMMVVRAMFSGCNLRVAEPVSCPFKGRNHPLDFVALTPFQLVKSMEDLHHFQIKNIIVGGAPVSDDLISKLGNMNAAVYETYGMTETCSHIALRRLNGGQAHTNFQTLNGVITDIDKRGCLQIKVPGITNGVLTTNDLVEIINENEFKWLGRFDHVINSGGIKLFPENIEKKLSFIINQPYFISSLPDDLLGEKIVLVLEGQKLSKQQENKLLNSMQKYLARYEIPRMILYKDKLMRTANGKIKRVF